MSCLLTPANQKPETLVKLDKMSKLTTYDLVQVKYLFPLHGVENILHSAH